MRFLNIGSEAVIRKNLGVINEFVYELIRTKIKQAQNLQDNSLMRTTTKIIGYYFTILYCVMYNLLAT